MKENIKLWNLVTAKYPHGDFPVEPIVSFDGKIFFDIIVCPVMTKNRATICMTVKGERHPAKTYKLDATGSFKSSDEIKLSESKEAKSLDAIPDQEIVSMVVKLLLASAHTKK